MFQALGENEGCTEADISDYGSMNAYWEETHSQEAAHHGSVIR
jgi:hypothetical protein